MSKRIAGGAVDRPAEGSSRRRTADAGSDAFAKILTDHVVGQELAPEQLENR
ncbi:hypothetical protein [Streptomyces sp. NBC_00073]|uniref:hypothetical protein n=1 Tax=Streptomyces sp. NBC_00073 TaxID=2975640 RepID=UPI0032474C90